MPQEVENIKVTETGAKPDTGNSPAEASSFLPPTIYSETVGHVGSFEIRNTLLMSWISVLFLCVVAWRFSKNYMKNDVPTALQNIVEMIIEGLFDFFQTVTQDIRQTKQFFGICATIFLFIVVSNWFGIFPGVGPIGIWEVEEGHKILVPLFRSTFSDVNMTLAIAFISVFMTQVFGMMNLKFGGYWGKFFVNPFRDPIGFAVGLLELVSEFSKIISFSFRLYGLELFVGLVQALVFSLLTLVFFKMGSTGHGGHDEVAHTSEQKHVITAS